MRTTILASLTLFIAFLTGCPDEGGKRPLGATCDDSAQCESGLCLDGICVDPNSLPDTLGDADTSPDSDSGEVSVEPPVAVVSIQPAAVINNEVARFEFTSDPIGAVFECILDGGPPVPCTSPYEVTVGEGTHTMTIIARWPDGTVDPNPPTFTWTVDLTAPVTTLGTAPPAYDNSVEVDITFTANEVDTTFECRLDTAAFAACTSPWTVGPLADGPHTIEVRAIDLAGNVEAPARSHSWTVDTSTPDTTLTDPPTGDVSATEATFTFSSPATPPATFECALDEAPFTACTSPHVVTALDEGEHTFEVRAVNVLGVVDPTPAFATWTVDTTPPLALIIEGPSGFTAISTPTFVFSVEGEPVVIECRVDDEAFAPCTSPHTTAQLADGDHTFELRAFDAAGNEDSDLREFIVDTTFPSVLFDSGPEGPTNDNTPTFAFTTGAAVETTCRLDGGPSEPCASPITLGPLPDGPHTLEVHVENAAGTAASASRSFSVDTAVPTLTLTGGPTGPTHINPPAFPFDVEADITVECRVDDQPFAPCTTPFSPAPLTDGPHTFEVRATDLAGNVSTRSQAFSIDTTAPTLSVTGGPTGTTNTNPPTFQLSTGDATTVECRIDQNAWLSCGASFTPAALSEGAHTFEARASDALGNTSTVSRAFTIDTVAPTLTITDGPSGPTNTNPPTFSFTTGTDAANVQCRVDGGAFLGCSSPHTIPASLSEGNHTFEVRVSDAVGNTATAARAFTIDTTAPTVAITNGPSGPTNTNPPTFSFTHGADAATVECRVDTGGFGPCTSPHTTASLPQGNRTFEVRVTDALGNAATVSRAFSIDTTPPTITITGGPSGPTNSNPPAFSFTAGADASTVQCRVDGNAFVACTSPWSPAALTQGEHTFEVRVADSLGNQDNSTRTFSVDTIAPTLSITGGPTAATNVNPPTFTFTHGADAATIECRIGAGAFAACTSPFTPASLPQGANTFEVRVADSLGNQATANRAFSIDTVAPTLSITGGPSGPTNVNPPAFTFTVGADATTVECRVDTGAFAPCTSPHTTVVLPQGARSFEVRASDAVGNQVTVSRSFSIDTVAPTINITGGPDGTTNVNPPTFTFTAGADATSVQCRIDAAAFANCTSPYTPASLAQGAHTFEVRVADSLGNQATATRAFTIDTSAPPVSITAGPNGPTNVNPPTFSFTVGAGATTIQCRVDGGAYTSCTSPYTTASLSQGAHTFEVRAADALGNAATASRAFSIDTVAPTLSFTAGPTGPTNANPPTFSFTAGADATTVQCRVDAAAFANCTSPFTTASLSQGAHTFDVRASDALGNTATVSRSFSIDTVAPTLSITSGPTGPTANNPVQFAFTAGADAASVQCRIDAAAFANCTSPYVTPVLSQGAHTFEVRAADALGNTATVSRSFSIDTVPPTASITSGPSGPTATNPPTFAFTVGADATTIQCSVDAEPFANCTSPFTPATLSQGAHTFYVQVGDALGNRFTAPRSFSIDTVGPTMAFTSGPSGPTNVNPPTFEFTIGDAVAVECQVDQGAWAACTSPRTTGQLSQGAHTFNVRGKDTLGNETLISRSFNVDTVPPTLTITGGPSGPTNVNPPTFTFTHGADATGVRCRVGIGLFVDCTSPWTPSALGQGAQTFEVRVTDAVGNIATASRSFSIDTQAPNLTITSGPEGPVANASPTFEFTVGADAVTVQCRLDTANFAACQSPMSYVRLLQGPHTFEVRATDALGNSITRSRAFTVDTIGPSITITSGPSGPTSTNPPSWKFTAGADAVAVRCRIDQASYVACSGDYQPTALTQGAHTFEVQAEDSLGNTNTAAAFFTIDTVAPSLSITGGPSGLTNQNPPQFTFSVGNDATTVQCRVDINTWASCTSPHTTASLSQGAHTFSVRAYDALGNMASVSRSFTVDSVAPVVTITSGPANNSVIYNQSSVTFQFSVSGATSIQCRLYVQGTLILPSYAACTSPYTRTIGYNKYVFQVRGIDDANNVTTITRTFENQNIPF